MSAAPLLVTGATGFLGKHLLPILLDSGMPLRLLVRDRSKINLPPTANIHLAQGDLTDPQSVRAALQGCRAVIHAGALFRFWGSAQNFEQINLQGTRNLLEAAKSSGEIERFIHISTIAVIGKTPPNETITEETACHPQDDYQRSKYAAEQLALHSGLPMVVLRPGAFYGPGSKYGFNRLFVGEPLSGWRVQVEGGKRLIFPVYVRDVAQAAVLALQRGEAGEIYNICDDAVSHAQINDLVSQLAGISAWRLNVPQKWMIFLAALMERAAAISQREPFYPLNLRHYVFQDWRVSNAKARRALGFVPTPLAEGLRATIAWYRGG